MPIKVLLVEDSEAMRVAVRRLLKEDPRITLVAEATTFAQAMQMRVDFKPEMILMELHLPERRDLTGAFVKSQLLSVPLLAFSLSNDEEAHALALSCGALALLDKMTLYTDLIPAIIKFAPKRLIARSLDGRFSRVSRLPSPIPEAA